MRHEAPPSPRIAKVLHFFTCHVLQMCEVVSSYEVDYKEAVQNQKATVPPFPKWMQSAGATIPQNPRLARHSATRSLHMFPRFSSNNSGQRWRQGMQSPKASELPACNEFPSDLVLAPGFPWHFHGWNSSCRFLYGRRSSLQGQQSEHGFAGWLDKGVGTRGLPQCVLMCSSEEIEAISTQPGKKESKSEPIERTRNMSTNRSGPFPVSSHQDLWLLRT